MDNLRRTLETLSKENISRKSEIITCLQDLVNEFNTSEDSNSKDCVHLIAQCEYEKKLHERLTEIQFELNKFVVLNERPVSKTKQNENPNIGTLIQNTTKLLAQIEQLSTNKEPNEVVETNNIRKETIEKLSDQTKDLLNNLSDSHNSPQECKEVEKTIIESKENNIERESENPMKIIKETKDDVYCGHHMEIRENFPQISKSCNSGSSENISCRSTDTCNHFPEISNNFPEINTICPDLPKRAIQNENTAKPKISTEALDKEFQKNITQLQFSSLKTKQLEKLNNTQSDDDDESQINEAIESISSETKDSDSEPEKLINNEFEEAEIWHDSADTEAKYYRLFGVNENKNLQMVQNNLMDEIFDEEDTVLNNQTTTPVKDCNLNANIDKPIFTTESKISTLGMDRREVFENKREITILPDLSLQPSSSDSESIKIKSNYVINDRKITKLSQNCYVCHVESPSEFYIHLDNEETSYLDDFNAFITDHFKKTKTPFHSKAQAFKSIGKFCCAYLKTEKIYNRAEIIDWKFESLTKLVLVKLVDYGRNVFVHFKQLREIPKKFCILSKFAIKCYLPMLYPPGSVRTSLLKEWPQSSIEAFKDLAGLNEDSQRTTFKIGYMDDEGEIFAVDLYKANETNLVTLGKLLIELNHAVEIILPQDDPEGIIEDEEAIQRLEECDNLNEVILGYDPKDEGRICRFTRKDGTCFKGKNCRLEHVELPKGGFTSDKVVTYVSAFSEISTPREGDHLDVRFTVLLDASHYYINLVKFADSLSYLEGIMNDNRNVATFKSYKLTPAFSEIVLVKHWTKKWLRGKVRQHYFSDDGHCTAVQVFMVDSGDTIDAKISDVRHIKPEHLEISFQAIECVLHNYKMSNNVDLREIDKYFYENIYSRTFTAKVIGLYDSMLNVQVFHKNKNLGKILCDKGFLTRVEKLYPSEKARAIPSG